MNKKQSFILSLLSVVTILSTLVSLFLPYLLKLNICAGDLTLPKMYTGQHFLLTYVILSAMFASVLSLWLFEQQIITVMFSTTALILTYLLRYQIHFQGFIDHEYDSKSGMGYLLLFLSVLTHSVISLSAFVVQRRNRKKNSTTT